MLDASVIEVVIGLAVIFLVFSLAAAGIYEGVAKLLAWRAKNLWAAIRILVDGPTNESTEANPGSRLRHMAPEGDRRPLVNEAGATNVARLYAHPLVGGLERRAAGAKTRIDRIEPSNFARAFIDVFVPDDAGQTGTDWRAWINNNANGIPEPLKQQLLVLVREAGDDVNALRTRVEGWFDGQMAVLSEAYRKRARWFMVVIGLLVAGLCNVDAITATQRLYREDALRASLVAEGERIAEACRDESDDELTTCLKDEDGVAGESLELPVGWQDNDFDGVTSVAGWVVGGLAISQGAPFWFDVLKRVLGFRKRSAPDAPSS